MQRMSEQDRATLVRAWERYLVQRERNDEIRRQAAVKNAAKLAPTLQRLTKRGYSLSDLAREVGVTKQALHEILRRAEADS